MRTQTGVVCLVVVALVFQSHPGKIFGSIWSVFILASLQELQGHHTQQHTQPETC